MTITIQPKKIQVLRKSPQKPSLKALSSSDDNLEKHMHLKHLDSMRKLLLESMKDVPAGSPSSALMTDKFLLDSQDLLSTLNKDKSLHTGKSIKDDPDFKARRQLALISHNNMKPTMKKFVEHHVQLLKFFKITGTASTMKTVKAIFKKHKVDHEVEYGRSCASGPLGGDAQIGAALAEQQIGAIIFFEDPMSAHPHDADIRCLTRLALVHDVLLATNKRSADSLMFVLKAGLKDKRFIESFYHTFESASVPMYRKQQQKVVAKVINSGQTPNVDVLTPMPDIELDPMTPVKGGKKVQWLVKNDPPQALKKLPTLKRILNIHE